MEQRALPNTLRIDTSQLTIGMFVSELDRPWTETPFLFQQFLIRDPDEIRQLQELCRYVWIDVKSSHRLDWVRIENLLQQPRPDPALAKVKFTHAIEHAEPVWRSARDTSLRILSAVKLDQKIDIETVKTVIKGCVESILETPSAMLWLARIKNSDEYTAEHSLRVAILSIALGRELGLAPVQLEEIGICGMLHDVGKLMIPNEILNKPGALTREELKIMQSHAFHGRQLLLGYSQQMPPSAIDVAFTHHERLNGGGYPRGLGADKISYYAKIVAVADSYDAINSDRVYSKGRSSLESLRILYEAANSHFDGEIVTHFIRLVGIYSPGEIAELSNGEVGIILGCDLHNKLKPHVLIVLDRQKRPCKERVIDLAKSPLDEAGRPYRVREVFPSGAFGIDIDLYRRKGLIIPANL